MALPPTESRTRSSFADNANVREMVVIITKGFHLVDGFHYQHGVFLQGELPR